MNNQELEPAVEVAHLRRLLDIQPGCLLRIGADGTVLAANDAALALLGVTSRAHALGRKFADWVPPEEHDRWNAFAGAVVQGAAASVECDLITASGDRRASLFRAVPLADHPDGVASLIVAVRAVSGQRQVEAAIVEIEEQFRERDAERLTARERLAEMEAGRRQLEETVAALEACVQEHQAAASGIDEQLRRLRADLDARDEALAAADAARGAADTNGARLQAEVRQLEMALEAFASRRPQPSAAAELEEARAGRARLESALQEAQQALARLEDRERLAREQRDALQARLDETQAACRERESERDALQARLGEVQAVCRERESEGEELQARLNEVQGACERRETQLRHLQDAQAELAASHAATVAEHDRLLTALREQAMHLGALAGGLSRSNIGTATDDEPVVVGAGDEEGRA